MVTLTTLRSAIWRGMPKIRVSALQHVLHYLNHGKHSLCVLEDTISSRVKASILLRMTVLDLWCKWHIRHNVANLDLDRRAFNVSIAQLPVSLGFSCSVLIV